MKWVQVSGGRYKFVDDSDERPEVDLPNKEGVPTIITKPPWADSEYAIHDPQARGEDQEKAVDHFTSEREKTIKTSSKWARWEKSRKESWQKDKPAWKKERVEKEKAEEAKIIKQAISEV